MTFTIRGWKGNELIFERQCDADNPGIPQLGAEHAQRMDDGEIDMVEMIFPDGHHLRFGLNPDRMVRPAKIDIEELPQVAVRLSKHHSSN